MPTSRVPEPLALSSRAVNLIAVTLLAILAVLLVSSVRQQSQTFDESTHLFAGFNTGSTPTSAEIPSILRW